MQHERIIKSGHHTRRTLYIIAGFYVASGFALAIPAALAGDRLSAFLGFLVISGALGFAAAGTVLLHIAARVFAIGDSLEQVRSRFERLERPGQVRAAPVGERDPDLTQELDLAVIGSGDASALVAATLDRARFPRLAASMDDEPPSPGARPKTADSSDAGHRPPDAHEAIPVEEARGSYEASDVADKNLMRVWKLALRHGDLLTCREVLSALLDTASPDLVAELTAQLERAGARVEGALRTTFSRRVRERDYAGALSVGEQIRRLFPNQPITQEFDLIRPHLRRGALRQGRRNVTRLAVAP